MLTCPATYQSTAQRFYTLRSGANQTPKRQVCDHNAAQHTTTPSASDVALPTQQRQCVVQLVVHIAGQGPGRLLNKTVPQRQVIVLVHARRVGLNELSRQWGCHPCLRMRRTRLAAAFSVSSVFFGTPAATHKNSVSSECSSSLPCVGLGACWRAAVALQLRPVHPGCGGSYRPRPRGRPAESTARERPPWDAANCAAAQPHPGAWAKSASTAGHCA